MTPDLWAGLAMATGLWVLMHSSAGEPSGERAKRGVGRNQFGSRAQPSYPR
jgi:hypothetical protein